MNDNSRFKQFKLVHELKRRIRIIVPSLYKNEERALILKILLLKREAVSRVKIVPAINSVTIHFDSEQLPKINLFILLEGVLTNFINKPSENFKQHIPGPSGHPEKQIKDQLFVINGMSCGSCAMYLEMLLKRQEAIEKVNINALTGIARVKGWMPKDEIFSLIEVNGYHPYSMDTVSERKVLLANEQNHLGAIKKRLIFITLLEVPVFFGGFLYSGSQQFRILQAAFSLTVMLMGGKDIFKKSLSQLKQGVVNMDTLVTVGASSAYAISFPAIFDLRRHVYFDAATAIIGFSQLGQYLESLNKNRMISDIESLVSQQDHLANRIADEKIKPVEIDQLQLGDTLIIRPGERIPVDGEVISGLSVVDESLITGAEFAVIKETGHILLEGSINGSGVLRMKTTAVGKNTHLASLIHMMEQSQSSKVQIQQTIDVLSSRLMPMIMALSAGTFFSWLLRGETLAHSLSNALSVLMISCPCALGLTTPVATSVSVSRSAKQRIYIKNGQVLELMSKVETVAFDKSGTLTLGQAEVEGFINLSRLDDKKVLQLAASVEINSEHNLAKSIVEYVEDQGISLLATRGFHSIPEQGVRCQVGNHEVLLGNESWMSSLNIGISELKHASASSIKEGASIVYLVVDNQAVAVFALRDAIRQGVQSLIHQLQEEGVKTLLLTGDTLSSANKMAELTGIDEIKADLSAADKIAFIQGIQANGEKVAMVGDGINDAPALAAADVAIVIGRSAALAIEASDFILEDRDISKVIEIKHMSEKTLRVVHQNIAWAFAYNVLAIPVAMAGKLNPFISSTAMAVSSLSVILNSMRLRK